MVNIIRKYLKHIYICRDENAYTTAIRAVAEILQDYDYGQYIENIPDFVQNYYFV
jgi:hypothetical protein